MQRTLSHEQAARFYDKLGSRLDTQSFYEDAALRELVAHLRLADCRALLEYGCGTGRLAGELLIDRAAPESTYLGLDVSGAMVAVAKARLQRYGGSAEVRRCDGKPRIDAGDGRFDLFVCTYVLDLLSDDDIRALIGEAHRVLTPSGTLGLASLTNGPTRLSRFVSETWRRLHAMSPWLVGGCRPIMIERFLAPAAWIIEYSNVVTRFGVPTEVLVARPL